MILTIVTVVRNDAENLARTISNIRRWKGSQTEFIVIDGASTDATLSLIESASDLVDKYISEPDNGIYDAMNKGIAMASGRYINFLNAGDEFLLNPEEMITSSPDYPVFIYGRANIINNAGVVRHVQGKKLRSIRRFFKGMPMCHQSVLYRRDKLNFYDTNYKVISDRVLTFKIAKENGLNQLRFFNKPVVSYCDGGFSSSFPREYIRSEENRFLLEESAFFYLAWKKLGDYYRKIRGR